MIRGEGYEISRPLDDGINNGSVISIPTASIASMVHIDTDVGAYENIDDFISIIDKNKIEGTSFPKERVIKSIKKGCRFAIINFWRNIDAEQPVQTAPLGILHTQYEDKYSQHETGYSCFPNGIPDMTQSKWYTYPNMTIDECLLFLQYDRLLSQPSDLWHGALKTVSPAINDEVDHDKTTVNTSMQPRKSFDIRAFIVFDEKVPPELDRFHRSRLRPKLSLEQSGCFCEEQAEKRRG